MGKETIYLVDGSGYIFRAYYAIRPLSTRDGTPTNAVLGVARMLIKLIREQQPDYLAVAFDPRRNFRKEIFGAYKANRDAPPEDLAPQFALVRECVEAMDIPVLLEEGYEADDVIASMARQAEDAGYNTVIVSADKDLMQLVRPHVAMYDPMKDRHFDSAAVEERFGVAPDKVADVQALAGDSSDNIPGVPKVGPKSAAKLVRRFGDVEAVIKGLTGEEKLKAFERSVLEHQEAARLSKKLTVLATDAPVTLDLLALRYRRPDPEHLGPFLRKIEAVALMRELAIDSEGDETKAEPVAPARTAWWQTPIDRGSYRTLTACEDLDAFLAQAAADGTLSFDLETTSLDPMRADVVGVALASRQAGAAYVPIGHRYLGVPAQIPAAEVWKRLGPLLADVNVRKVGQNLKYDALIVNRLGFDLQPLADDSMLAAYVLDATRPSFGLDALAREVLGHENLRYQDLTKKGRTQIGFDEVPVDEATAYAAEDADVALRLCAAFGEQMKDSPMLPLYRDLELPLVPVLGAMERAGIKVDTERLRAIGKEFSERLQHIEKQAHDVIGRPVNLASPKQLSHLFFEELGLPVVKKTKTGYSTDQEVLETLADQHQLPRIVLEHRLLAKLKSTYVDALLRLVNADTQRVHTSFNQAGTATGRLSSSEPNLQNIPIRSDDGRRIRDAFVAEPDHVLISADYSQIELRVMAHLSADPRFVDAFQRGLDIHRQTAMEILTDGQEPDAEMRRRAKAINFGILYGLSEFGLAKQLGIARSDAKAYIQAYFGRYPGIRHYLDAAIEQGRQQGYVETLLGRRRALPNLTSKNRTVRQAAERVAMNTPIQGTAADLIKQAMLRVHAAIEKKALKARLLLQVHDELVVEAHTDDADVAAALLKDEMEAVMDLAVPLVVEVGQGKTWAEAH